MTSPGSGCFCRRRQRAQGRRASATECEMVKTGDTESDKNLKCETQDERGRKLEIAIADTATMSNNIIEHVVLFKVKDDVAPSEVDAMVNRINSLNSLDQTLHLTMAPLLSFRSTQASLNFTHILHARYNSKHDLEEYTVHPSHVAVVKVNAPLCQDIMAFDWVANENLRGESVILAPGSAIQVTLFKLKEGLEDRVDEILRAVMEIQEELKTKGAVQVTCGDNFSPGRAKGFSMASLVVFPGLKELEAADSHVDIHKNHKIKDYLECVMVVDFVVPSLTASN
ncbi:stress-response A/B barrel domain-containing protein DABB1 [Arachis hypogaea]|nr:stress-response A/B barrel domain-containing protein DABB1 [Arachis hypogaea]